MKPVILDAFCKAGGATKGYQRAGFYVIGVDKDPQPHYVGDGFIQADALDVLIELVETGELLGHRVAGVHASPPCQASSTLRHLWKDREHPELIPPTRELLTETGLPYVIENVPGAALRDPIVLCGSHFRLGANGRELRRHRLFESTFEIEQPICRHDGPVVGVYGHGGGGIGNSKRGYKGTKEEYRIAMGIDWATKAEIAQAIPPSYTAFVGSYLMQAVEQGRDQVAA